LFLSSAVLSACDPSAAPATSQGAVKSDVVDVQILAINDFHGNLQAPPGTTPPVGGAAFLSTHLRGLRDANPNSIVVSAGDNVGGSPLISALFHDEPAIEALDLLGLELSAVGNHEFDEGSAELHRLQEGGCHPTDGCQDGDDFAGANFKYLAANVLGPNGKPFFRPYKIRTFEGARVAFIGLTLQGTPSIVAPSGVAGLTFLDEVETVNALVTEIREKGVEAIVVLLHEGMNNLGGSNTCPGASGPLGDIVRDLDPAVDVVVSGHTHQSYVCDIHGKLVTSAQSFGTRFTQIQLKVDRETGHVVERSALNRDVTTVNVIPDPAVEALVNRYAALVAPLKNRVIGSVTADLARPPTVPASGTSGESTLGNVIADAQLEATSLPANGGAVVAFMNRGGIRAAITYASITGGEAVGEVTYGEAFDVQPFGNSLVTMTLTGAQMKTILEQQWLDQPANRKPRILQPSAGFHYTWCTNKPDGDRVLASSMTLKGVPVDAAASYRVTVNSFLADGGDGFAVLKDGTSRLGGAVDLDAFEAYLGNHSPISPPALGRIDVRSDCP
jgi:5'-nucleotidase